MRNIYSYFQTSQSLVIFTILLIVTPVYFYNAIFRQYPIGYAGFFALISDSLINNNYHPIEIVPYYAIDGLPFAYPPLGIYLMAFVTGILKIPVLEYLKFAPPFFMLITLIPMYLLNYYFLRSKFCSFISVLLACFSNSILFYYLGAGGAIRGLALFFTFFGIYFAFEGISGGKRKYIIMAGVFFGATILTHLSYVVFMGLTLVLYVFLSPLKRRSFLFLGVILIIGLLFSSPWWVNIIQRFGPQIFMNALNSHNNGEIVYRLLHSPDFTWLARNLYFAFSQNLFIGFISLLGSIFLLFKKKWFLSIWFYSVLFLLSESDRYLIVLGCVISTCFAISLFTDLINYLKIKTEFLPSFLLIGFLIINIIAPIKTIFESQSGISNETFLLSNWFQLNTEDHNDFIMFMNEENYMEWMPYFLKRNLTYPYWGSEWLGLYNQQELIWKNIMKCYQIESFDCLENIFRSLSTRPEFIILSTKGLTSIRDQMEQKEDLVLKYKNSGYSVWMYQSPKK